MGHAGGSVTLPNTRVLEMAGAPPSSSRASPEGLRLFGDPTHTYLSMFAGIRAAFLTPKGPAVRPKP